MVSDELIVNSRRNMLETLRCLSSADSQRRYRDAVPYVHVPNELACQWDQYATLLREQAWFRDSLTAVELNAVLEFDGVFHSFCDQFGRDLPELQQLWDDPRWSNLGLAAAKALEAFA